MSSNDLQSAFFAFDINAKSKKGENSSKLGLEVFNARGILSRRVFLIYVNFNNVVFPIDKQMALLQALEPSIVTPKSDKFVDPEVAAEVLEINVRVIKRFLAKLKDFVGFDSKE